MYYQNELYHHGILGQRWGVRRFQNLDGTRTPEGKKRYGDSDNKSHIGRNIAIGVGAAVAIGAAGYAIGTGRINVGGILKSTGLMPAASVPKKPSKATLAIVEANKQFKINSMANKKPSKATLAVVEANRQFGTKKPSRISSLSSKIGNYKKVLSEKPKGELRKEATKHIKDKLIFKIGKSKKPAITSVASTKSNAELLKDINNLIKDNQTFKLHVIDTSAGLHEQADQLLSVYGTITAAG